MNKASSINESVKTCLITGGNGYLGKYIQDYLTASNYKVATLGRGNNNTYQCDLSDAIPTFVESFTTVIHCAGKAHSFPKTSKEHQAFFDVNVKGTQNLLKSLENLPVLPKHFVFISSVSVYGLNEGFEIGEDTPLSSKYSYGLSKISAEEIIQLWSRRNNVLCLVLRLPLLAGKNPPGNLKLMIDGIKKGQYFNISKKAIRKSIVMAEDVAKIIPTSLGIGGTYNLTDGCHPSFKELADLIAEQLGKPKPKSLPNWLGDALAFFGNKFSFLSPINAYKLNKLTSSLTFDDSKARKILNWNPQSVLKSFKID